VVDDYRVGGGKEKKKNEKSNKKGGGYGVRKNPGGGTV